MSVTHTYCSAISIGTGYFGFRSDRYVFKNTAFGKLLESNKLDVPNPIPIPNDTEDLCTSFFLVGVKVFAL